MRKFDLNIEKILENWEVYHAVRELIANAIDEQILSRTIPIEIYKENGKWIIQDFGRGIKYTSLTQNENQEKLNNSQVIGKFGIGLKDALATLHRHYVSVTILSKFNKITTELLPKEGFKDIQTLHAMIDENVDPALVGTRVCLNNIADEDIEKAKKLFLMFSGSDILSITKHGEVVSKTSNVASIYINGVKIAEEENFLFSYNITNISAQIKKALNRERSNVGRTAYTSTIKNILLSSRSEAVARPLALELEKYSTGEFSDELQWIDIQEHAIKILNPTGKYVFLTNFEATTNNSMIDEIKSSGKTLIIIPENLREKIRGGTDIDGKPIWDLHQFEEEYEDSFEFHFINEDDLNPQEKITHSHTKNIVKLFGGLPREVKSISISETMRKDFCSSHETLGCWDPKTRSIVILRSQLESLPDYCGTLIHELIHAKTGFEDVDRDFENELTHHIGKYLSQLLTKKL